MIKNNNYTINRYCIKSIWIDFRTMLSYLLAWRNIRQILHYNNGSYLYTIHQIKIVANSLMIW